MARMLRCLFFIEAKFCCTITSSHIPGQLNERADALSRNQLTSFFSLTPQAEQQQVPVPHVLVEGLVKLNMLLDVSSLAQVFKMLTGPINYTDLQCREESLR